MKETTKSFISTKQLLSRDTKSDIILLPSSLPVQHCVVQREGEPHVIDSEKKYTGQDLDELVFSPGSPANQL